MKKNLLLMALLCLTIPFVSCSSSSDDEDEYESSGRSSKTESLLYGRWIPYTLDDGNFSFLDEVGWIDFNKNHTFEFRAYDKSLALKGKWNLTETTDMYDRKTIEFIVDGWGEIWQTYTNKSKKEIDNVLIGSRWYFVVDDIHSNYMRIVRIMLIYPTGETENVSVKMEWRRE